MTTYPTSNCAVGLDIGGTNMVAGVVEADNGRVISRMSVPTDSRQGHQIGLQRIADLINTVITTADVPQSALVGIGIGSTGPVDSITGYIYNPHTLPGWDALPIVPYLTEQFHLPATLLIDTHVAVLGEHWVGAGKGGTNVVYITVGTGIGAGIILNNRLYRGTGLFSGEVGHITIDLNGPECYCGGRGCWEMLAAAPAISTFASENVPNDSLLLAMADGNRQKISALLVSQAADAGDSFAQSLMERTAFFMGTGIANLMNILAPDYIILGGGVMQSWSKLAPTILETVRKRAVMIPFDTVQIVPAALGLDAGITGAARAILAQQSGDPILG